MNRLIYSFLALFLVTFTAVGQSVSVAPSRLYYKVNPGQSKAQTVKVTNNSGKKQTFQISFTDFEAPGSNGKSSFLKPGESPNSLVKNISANPSLLELEPGQSRDVQILLELPNLPESNKVKWGALMIKLTKERSEATKLGGNNMGMGIVETVGIVVHVFQTPPSITFSQAEIASFKQEQDANGKDRVVSLLTKNTGETILICGGYIELVNLKTGKKERMQPTGFTIYREDQEK